MTPDIVFFGTSPRSADFLNRIVSCGLKPALVVSVPPKPVGRKGHLTENPVVTTTKNLKIQISDNIQILNALNRFTTKSGDTGWGTSKKGPLAGVFGGKPAAGPETGNRLQKANLLGLILDFNKIIPAQIIDRFPAGIINIHFSKLPQDRGPARGDQFILRGERQAWISYLLITPGLDEGPLLGQTALTLSGRETFGELSDRLVTQAAVEIGTIINDYLAGKITPRPQEGKPTYARKFTKDDFFIPAEALRKAIAATKLQSCKVANMSTGRHGLQSNENYFESLKLCNCAACLDKLIRAATPSPHAWTQIKLQRSKAPKIQRLKLLSAHLENNRLVLDEVQLEGKNPVSWKQFCQGYPDNNLIKK